MVNVTRHLRAGCPRGGTWRAWAVLCLGNVLILNPMSVWAASTGQEVATVGMGRVLLPLALAAVAIERAVELIWNYIEWLVLSAGRWQPAALKSSQYLQFKSGSSLVLGMILGILLANYLGLHLLRYLTPYVSGFLDSVPVVWDVILTGVVIGAAAKPIHEVLGILTQFKNFLGYAAVRQRERAGAELADGVLKLAESERKMMIDVPGVGPSHLPSRQALAPEENGDETENAGTEPSRTERYVRTLRDRTVK